MKKRSFRVLIGILHSGEAEYPLAIKSAQTQIDIEKKIFTISGKENKDAHDSLYSEFMRCSDDFDFFFKLDADMTIRESNGLSTLITHAVENDAAHVMSYVLDCPSGLVIPGVQLFRSDSRWNGSDEALNVDYPPKLNGRSLIVNRRVYVDHMTAPHDYQLFRYGIHKAVKAIQPERGANKSIQKFLLHTAILNGIAQNTRKGEHQLRWALIGALFFFTDRISGVAYHSDETQCAFNDLKNDLLRQARANEEAHNFFFNEVQTLFRFFSKFQIS